MPYACLVSETIRSYLGQRFQHLRPVAPRRNFSARWKLTAPHRSPIIATCSANFHPSCDLRQIRRYQPTLAELELVSSAPPNFCHATKPLLTSAHSNGRRHEPGPIRLPVGAFVAALAARSRHPARSSRQGARPSNIPVSAFHRARSRRKVQAGGWLSALRYFVLFWCIIALARPQKVESSTQVQESGIDMILAIDLSPSMEALDYHKNGEELSRVQVVRETWAISSGHRPRSHRHGRLLRRSYLMSPLTLDQTGFCKTGASPHRAVIGGRDGHRVGPRRLRQSPARREIGSRRSSCCLTGRREQRGQKSTPLAAAEAAHALASRFIPSARVIRRGQISPHGSVWPASPTPRFSRYRHAALQKIADIAAASSSRGDYDTLKRVTRRSTSLRRRRWR